MGDGVLYSGLEAIVEKAFLAVFDDVNKFVDTRVQTAQLLHGGHQEYAKYIARRVGTFQLFGSNRTARIDTAYVDIQLSAEIRRARYRTDEAIQRGLLLAHEGGQVLGPKGADAVRSPLAALEEKSDSHFALVGHAGTGKSTVLRHLAVTVARGTPLRGRKRLPVFLAVRDMSRSRMSINTALLQLLQSFGIREDERAARFLLESGSLVLLLDGIDETDDAHRRELLRELTDIKERFDRSILCVSGRPYSLDLELPGFMRWETIPLSIPAREQLIAKWFESEDPAKGKLLIDQCRSGDVFLDMASSPLLLSIVCALFSNDLRVPEQNDELYSRCVEGLLGGWDAFRSIARTSALSDWSIRRRLHVVSSLAAKLFIAERIIFTRRDVDVDDWPLTMERTFDATMPDTEALLSALYNDFGILIEQSPGTYSFSHLALQEYLTARYHVETRTESTLATRWHEPRWRDVALKAAQILHVADEYVARLHNSADFASPNDARFLLELWRRKPIVSFGQKLTLVSRIALYVAALVDVAQSDCEIRGNYLAFNSVDRVLGAEINGVSLSELQSSFPYLLEIVRVSGLRMDALGVSGRILFLRLRDEWPSELQLWLGAKEDCPGE